MALAGRPDDPVPKLFSVRTGGKVKRFYVPIPAKELTERAKALLEGSIEPEWHEDPTYNLKRRP